MSIKYNITTFPTGTVLKALAKQGGSHIYNITASEDLPNGVFVGKGAFQEIDRYAAAAAGDVSGVIQCKLANGNYLVEIDECDVDTLFVSNVPLIEEQDNQALQKEENFYNPAGSELRSYQLSHGDTIELNSAALGLSADPASYPVSVTATAYGTSTIAVVLN